MSELERIVRPSQDGSIRPAPTIGYHAPPPTPNDNTITWGSGGATIFQISASSSISLPSAEWPKADEESRKYDVIRVKNPDDPDQHVDVEAMTQYQARNQIDKKRTTLNFTHQRGDDDNTEVLSVNNIRKADAEGGLNIPGGNF